MKKHKHFIRGTIVLTGIAIAGGSLYLQTTHSNPLLPTLSHPSRHSQGLVLGGYLLKYKRYDIMLLSMYMKQTNEEL